MNKDKSILEKFTDTVKELANSASEALKPEEPPKPERTNAAYMPFAAEGVVSDPLLVPPLAAAPPRPTRKPAKKSSARKAPTNRTAPKKVRKTAKTSARGKTTGSRSAARKSAKRTARATKGRSGKRSAKRSRR